MINTIKDLPKSVEKKIAGQMPIGESSKRLANAYVTVVTANNPVNKKYYFNKNTGKMEKDPHQQQFYEGKAICYYIPSVIELCNLVRNISENPNDALILGFHPGAIVGQVYLIYREEAVIKPRLVDGSIIVDPANSCWYIDKNTNEKVTSII